MKRMSLQEIQQCELELMKEFDSAARKNGLRYSLCAGTLLGAVRHRGFIPWDDDIDITMSRPDFDKLIRLNRQGGLFPSFIRLSCLEDGTLDSPYIKLFDTRTSIIEHNFTQKDVQSLWIDIFPVDGLPENEEEIRRIYRIAMPLSRMNVVSVVNSGYGKNRLIIFLKNTLIKPAARLIGRRNIALMQKKLALSHPYETYPKCGMVSWAYDGPGQALTKEEYEDLIELQFEGCSFTAFRAWDKYLTGVFGDYMTLPPEDERPTHDLEAYKL